MYRLYQSAERPTDDRRSTDHAATGRASERIEIPDGTLMWIGERSSLPSNDVYRYCESRARQIAYRADMDDAIARPASGVTAILVNRADHHPSFEGRLQQIASLYPESTVLEMLGSMWEGHARGHSGARETTQFYWHRWNQVLPPLFGHDDCSDAATSIARLHPSVAIIAANWSDADPLMQLASSAAATAIWCRGLKPMSARNFDIVWWDDSAAKAASAARWRQRLEDIQEYSSFRPRHVWLSTAPRVDQYRQALDGGIDVILSKPHTIDALMSTLGGCRTDSNAPGSVRPDSPWQSSPIRVAA